MLTRFSGKPIFALASKTGLTAWVDYLPVKEVIDIARNTTAASGSFVASSILSSITGLTKWTDYTPVFVEAGATVPWSTDATGYIPFFNVVADVTPSAFVFTDITGAAQSTVFTSNTIQALAFNAATVAVTITGGTYSKNGAAYTSAAGTAEIGDKFSVRVTSAGTALTAVNAALTIGGVVDTYTVTTA